MDDLLAARLLDLSGGFPSLERTALVELAHAVARAGPTVCGAALLHPPLSAPTAVVLRRWQSLDAWGRAFLQAPLECVLLSLRAVWVTWRFPSTMESIIGGTDGEQESTKASGQQATIKSVERS